MIAEKKEELDHLPMELRIFRSVMENDEKAVESLLNQGIDFSIKVKGPLSSIHIAVFKGYVNIVEQLLRHGADPNSRYPVAKNSYTGSTLLYQAAAQGSEAVLSFLLEYNADVKAKNKDGSTALHIAAEKGYLKIVKMLLEKGAEVNFEIEQDYYMEENFYREQFLESKILRNELNLEAVDVSNISIYDGVHTPLHLAIKAKQDDIMKLLIKSGADIDAIDSRGGTALSLAVQRGYLETFEYVLNRLPSLKNLGNKRSLIFAVKSDSERHKVIIQKLLQYGFTYDSELENEDWFLAEVAVCNAHYDVIREIFQEKKNFGNFKESQEKSSRLLITAIETGREDVANFLLEQGAFLDKAFCLSSMCSLKKYNLNFLKLLIANGLNVQNDSKLLFIAIKENMHEFIKILLINKADVNKFIDDETFLRDLSSSLLFRGTFPASNFKVSPLLVAAAIGDMVLVKLFLEYGADINFESDKGVTPLLMSVVGGHLEIVEILLNSGANVEPTNSVERTPLHLAAEFGHENILKLLLRFGAFNVLDEENWSDQALYLVSAEKGHLHIIQTLLEYDSSNIMNSASIQQKTPLHYAAKNGHSSTVKFLLDHGAEVNLKDDEGETALSYAAYGGHAETVEVLLEYGASVRTLSLSENTPLYSAAASNNDEVVQLLLKYGAKPNIALFSDFGSPLTTSADKGNLNIVDMLVKSGADVNFITPEGETALSLALKNGHTEVAKLLLRNGANFNSDEQCGELLLCCTKKGDISSIELLLNNSADVNSIDSEEQTALHLAIESNRVDVVQLLLKFGANVEAVDKKMKAPLALSAGTGNLEIVKILLKSGANIEAADNVGRTALYISAENGDDDVLNLLLEYGANSNHRAKTFKTPIIVAAEKGHFRILQTLVKSGAFIHTTDDAEKSAFYFAAECGCTDSVQLLLEYGAEFDSPAANGKTPLIISAEKGQFKIVKILAKRGVNVNCSNNKGQTALYFAAEYGHVDAVKLLLEHGAKVDASTENGKTPLIIASERGRHYSIDPLLKAKANIHATDKHGLRAVHYAAECGRHAVVKLLLKHCADMNCDARNDVSLLLNCAEKGFLQIVDTLMKFGAKFDLTTRPDQVNHLASTLYKWDPKVFIHVLEYGCADVKFLSKKTFHLLFDVVKKIKDSDLTLSASEKCHFNSILSSVLCYSLKMKAADLFNFDDIIDVTDFLDETTISDFESECNDEVSRMKCETVGDSDIFVHDILTGDLNRLALFARNNHISQALEFRNFNLKFPEYGEIICNQFDKGKIRRQLIDQCIEICLSSYDQFKSLPSNIIESILLYLNNGDLRRLQVSVGLASKNLGRYDDVEGP